MPNVRSRLVARLLWIFPAILLFLTINQIKVALDVRETLDRGVPATAEVVEIYKTNRVDVTYGYVQLRIPTAEGVIERRLSMSVSLLPELEGKDSLDVRVLSGEDQEIVVAAVARTQWRMAAINGAMSFVGLILLTIGVSAWNRYLKQKGDPADRVETAL